jgi:hypothetical protein
MAVDADRLAVLLAERLGAIVPAGFHVWAEAGMLWYSADEGRFPGQTGDGRAGRAGTHIQASLGVYGSTDADNIVGVAVQALGELQDYIDEVTHDPWPGGAIAPRLGAEIRDSAVHLWYGDHDSEVLSCEPIPLAAIISPAG